MIRQRLSELSLEALLIVASQNRVQLDPDLDREQIIDELVDVITENREERERNQSATIRVQQTKFSALLADDRPVVGDELDKLELPEQYEINRIVLMLRDPRWAYTYWDLSSGKRREYRESRRFDGLFVRVLELEDAGDELRIRDSFEIPVQLADSSWYIYLPRPEATYRVQLVARHNHRRELLAVSNSIWVPVDRLRLAAANGDGSRDRLYQLCGLEFLEVPPYGEQPHLEAAEM